MLQALIISIITAVVLGLIVISILKIKDAKKQQSVNVKKGVRELKASEVIKTKDSDDVTVKNKFSPKEVSEKLNKRIVGFGVAAVGIATFLAGKVASLQLFNQGEYQKAANDNQFKTVNTPAARGFVSDRNGRALAYSENVSAIVAEKDVVDDDDVMRRLSVVLGIPYGIVRKRILNSASGAQSRRVVCDNPRDRDIAWILEHKDGLPGVFVESRSERKYPYGALCAHVLGYTGYPTEEEVLESQDNSLSLDVACGKSGIESQYNSLLSGDAGQREVRVDADGNIVEVRHEIEAVRGSNIELTIDAHAQYVADKYLSEKCLGGKASTGAVVCLDAKTGGVVAMSSFPTFDPNQFTGGIPEEIWNLYSKEESKSPMLNRSISSGYAPGSTMKAMSAMAGLNYGLTSETTGYVCQGQWDGFGSDDIQKCWNVYGHGGLNLNKGIVVSCDVVFYEIAKQFFLHSSSGSGDMSDTALQDYYSLFNLGKKTGIDLADEISGRIPTPEWKKERWRNVPSNGNWVGGDYTNMIIGQGDVLVTPLQLACAYCCVATGRAMKPHLISKVNNSEGKTVVQTTPEVLCEPNLNKEHRAFVCKSLRDMVIADQAVTKLCNDAGIDMAGKTGTAEHANEEPDSLFVGYTPCDDPKYVAVCVLQHGDSATGDSAPIVVDVLKAALESEENGDLEVSTIEGYAGESLKSGSAPGQSTGNRSN